MNIETFRAATVGRMAGLLVGFAIFILLVDGQQKNVQMVIPETASPFRVLKQKGEGLVLQNKSKRSILRWSEACIFGRNPGERLLQVFPIDDGSPTKPGGVTVDSLVTDASPLMLCYRSGGRLLIWEVSFADGSKWQSSWQQKLRDQRQ